MMRTADGFASDELRVTVVRTGGVVEVTVAGELDLESRPVLSACLTDQLGSRPDRVVVETSGVSFLDSTGIAALLRAKSEAGHAGVDFGIVHPSQIVRRVLEMARVEHLLQL